MHSKEGLKFLSIRFTVYETQEDLHFTDCPELKRELQNINNSGKKSPIIVVLSWLLLKNIYKSIYWSLFEQGYPKSFEYVMILSSSVLTWDWWTPGCLCPSSKSTPVKHSSCASSTPCRSITHVQGWRLEHLLLLGEWLTLLSQHLLMISSSGPGQGLVESRRRYYSRNIQNRGYKRVVCAMTVKLAFTLSVLFADQTNSMSLAQVDITNSAVHRLQSSDY